MSYLMSIGNVRSFAVPIIRCICYINIAYSSCAAALTKVARNVILLYPPRLHAASFFEGQGMIFHSSYPLQPFSFLHTGIIPTRVYAVPRLSLCFSIRFKMPPIITPRGARLWCNWPSVRLQSITGLSSGTARPNSFSNSDLETSCPCPE